MSQDLQLQGGKGSEVINFCQQQDALQLTEVLQIGSTVTHAPAKSSQCSSEMCTVVYFTLYCELFQVFTYLYHLLVGYTLYKYVFSFCEHSFHFCDVILCSSKALAFEKFQFNYFVFCGLYFWSQFRNYPPKDLEFSLGLKV